MSNEPTTFQSSDSRLGEDNGEGEMGGIRFGGVYSLAYADDLVLMAEKGKEIELEHVREI